MLAHYKKNTHFEWYSANALMPGQDTSGDLCVVEQTNDGLLLAVIDGLGHGDEAHTAAMTAAACLKTYDNKSDTLIGIIRRCHESMMRTCGAAMSVALFNAIDSSMTWAGVGNVEAVLLRRENNGLVRESLLLRSGVVGYRLPLLKTSTIEVKNGDVLIFATDGITSGFTQEINLNEPLKKIADDIIDEYAKGTDDALVLVGRCNK